MLQLVLTTAIHCALALPQDTLPQDTPPPTPPEGPPPFMSRFEWDPEIERGLQLRTEAATPGLTFIQPLNGTESYLIDLDGEIVHRWSFDCSPGAWAYLLDDGNLLRAGREDEEPAFKGGGIGGRIQLIAPDSEVVWNYDLASNDLCQHHDLEPLPNGNLLVIAWERHPEEEAIAHGRDPEWVGEAGLWLDTVIELRPILPNGAEVVWQWRAWDHVIQDYDPRMERFGDVAGESGRIDINADVRAKPPLTAQERERLATLMQRLEALGYTGGVTSNSITVEADSEEALEERRAKLARSGDMMHTNGIDYLAEHDLIVLSSPELNEVFVIDHSTTTEEAAGNSGGRFGRGGELLWRWGNPKNYGAGEDDDQRLRYQHAPEWIVTDSGDLHLLVFNNGGGRGEDGEGWSSVEELALPFDPERGFVREASAAFGPSEPVWIHEDRERFFSAFISGATRLSSGNTLVCSGAGGRVFEVDPDGRTVWDYRNGLGGDVMPPDHAGKAPPLALFRAARYSESHPGIRAVLGD